MINNFEIVVIFKIRNRLKELIANCRDNWKGFIQALNEGYFVEDFDRITKRSFWSELVERR